MSAIDALEADVAGRLSALAAALPAARAFVASLLADHERHRAVRADVRRMLRLAVAAAIVAVARRHVARRRCGPRRRRSSTPTPRAFPPSARPLAVDAMARNMVDLARHLTVIDLWIEAEAVRG